MSRYLRTLRLFWKTSVAAEMEYRVNFVLAMVTSFGNLVGSIFALSLFYLNGTDLGGWSLDQALVVLGMATLLEGFSSTFLRPNVGRIVEYIREGTLDFVLLKPFDTQFWLSARNISIWGMPNMFFGLGIVVYAGVRLGVTGRQYVFSLLPVVLSLIILYSLWFMLSTTSIWFVKVQNMTGILRGVLDAGRFPVPAYPRKFQFVFTFVIPVAFLTTVPATTLLGNDAGGARLLTALILAALLFALSRTFWRTAIRFYTSASS